MLQFRLTQKFAKDCRLNKLLAPIERVHFFDDWVIDVVNVLRRKVAMVIHVKTLLTFYIPYADVGGAKHVIKAIPIKLEYYLNKIEMGQYVPFIKHALSTENLMMTKTSNRNILGHMNDFKRCFLDKSYFTCFEKIDFEDIMMKTSKIMVKFKGGDYTTPQNLVQKYLNEFSYLLTDKKV